MTCTECGADLPSDETCRDRFHVLLAAESHNQELARMHGLTVLTYHVQHPSLTKPWYQAWGYEILRRSFGQRQDWWDVLKGVQQHAHSATFQQWKRNYGPILPRGVVIAMPLCGTAGISATAPKITRAVHRRRSQSLVRC